MEFLVGFGLRLPEGAAQRGVERRHSAEVARRPGGATDTSLPA